MLQLQRHVADGGIAGREGCRHLAAYHVLNKLGAVGLVGVDGGDIFAVTEDGDAVGEGENLIETVGDEDDGHAIGLQFADDAEQDLHLCHGQRCRGLVEDEDACFLRHRLGDLHDLHMTGGEIADGGGGVNIDTEVIEDLLRDLAHLLLIDQLTIALAVADVLRRAQHVDEVELLIDALYAVLAGERGSHGTVGAIIDGNGAAIRRMGACNCLNKRGFAGAVFANDGVNLAGIEVDRNFIQGYHARINFCNVFQRQDRLTCFQNDALLIVRIKGKGRREVAHAALNSLRIYGVICCG